MKTTKNQQTRQPVVILGGFLSFGSIYSVFQKVLSAYSLRPVWVVPTQLIDWLPGTSKQGWARLLDKLDDTVHMALHSSKNEKVILVGHSAGGVLARLYLSPEPLLGRSYNGLARVSNLITLGSPHLNQGGLTRGGKMSRWVQSHVPNDAFAPLVHYTSIAGKFIQGNPDGKITERLASRVYQQICGDAATWGDALIPISSALLPGSEQIILEGVSHYTLFGKPWYGDASTLPYWWDRTNL